MGPFGKGVPCVPKVIAVIVSHLPTLLKGVYRLKQGLRMPSVTHVHPFFFAPMQRPFWRIPATLQLFTKTSFELSVLAPNLRRLTAFII